MAKRITNHSIVLHRAGKRVLVKPNTEVDLTDAELADINAANKDALRKVVVDNAPVEMKLPPADTPKGGKSKKDEKPAEQPAGAPAASDDDI
jgi:hypothetical protein